IVVFHVRFAPSAKGWPATIATASAAPVPCSIGTAASRGQQYDTADDVAKGGVVIDAADAPAVVDAAPAQPPTPDPAEHGLAPYQRAGDNRLFGRGAVRRRSIRERETPHCGAPAGKFRLARDAHIHAVFFGGGRKSAALLGAGRDLGAQQIGR